MTSVPELLASAYEKIRTASGVQLLVTNGVLGADPVGGPWEDGWIFQGLDDIRPFRDVKGTGRAAIVVRSVDTWGSNRHNTMGLPMLQVLVWADPTRNASGEALARNGFAMVHAVIAVIDPLLNDTANADHSWPNGISVISCVRADGPSLTEVPESDGVWRGELRYEVAI